MSIGSRQSSSISSSSSSGVPDNATACWSCFTVRGCSASATQARARRARLLSSSARVSIRAMAASYVSLIPVGNDSRALDSALRLVFVDSESRWNRATKNLNQGEHSSLDEVVRRLTFRWPLRRLCRQSPAPRQAACEPNHEVCSRGIFAGGYKIQGPRYGR